MSTTASRVRMPRPRSPKRISVELNAFEQQLVEELMARLGQRRQTDVLRHALHRLAEREGPT